ncbi:MAG: RNA polymerase sigma factor [Bacteroidales bacterium]|nr:RNA polymerase sigma factor [Bacteroidales bacterium]
MHHSDEEIIPLIQDESTREKGFDRLVKAYQQEVYWLIRRMVIDHDDADDLTQDTFVKVWNNLDRFRGESALFTWIYRIATNEALAHLRKKRISFSFLALEKTSTAAIPEYNDAFYRSDNAMRQFQKALAELPDKQRLIFNMKYYDDLTYEQISEITGTSVGGLKATYHQAVKKIKKKLSLE